MKKNEKEDRIDCHVSEDDCLLPEWAKKLRKLLEGETRTPSNDRGDG
ncbi:MAG: hypothetical protein WBD36_11220 [Bacteroidota bacterium]